MTATTSIPPTRLSLEYDKKQAKRLLRELKAGELQAGRRLKTWHPRYADADTPADVKLSDAQLVIAREYGYPSWPRWKAFVELAALELKARCDAFVRAACSSAPLAAQALLEREPNLGEANLYCAAVTGNAAAVLKAIAGDPEVAKRAGGPSAWQPILYACHSRFLVLDEQHARGIVEVVRTLLEIGADPNSYFLQEGETNPEHRQTALYGAAGIANNAALTELLLDAGADPNDSVKANPAGESIYHAAEFADTTCLRLLLSHGARKSAIDYCLGRAIDFENPSAAMAFLEHGADPNLAIEWFGHRTHFQKAIEQGRPSAVVEAMIDAGADLEKPDAEGLTPYQYAVRFGQPELAGLLARRGAQTSRATRLDRLFAACLDEDAALARKLVDEDSMLREQIRTADPRVAVQAASREQTGALVLLIEHGVDVDVLGDEGMNALHRACWWGNLAAVKYLVEAGADDAKVHGYDGTPLSTAMFASLNCHDRSGGVTSRLVGEVEPREYAEIVDYLLAHGVEPPAQGFGNDDVVDVLIRHGIAIRD